MSGGKRAVFDGFLVEEELTIFCCEKGFQKKPRVKDPLRTHTANRSRSAEREPDFLYKDEYKIIWVEVKGGSNGSVVDKLCQNIATAVAYARVNNEFVWLIFYLSSRDEKEKKIWESVASGFNRYFELVLGNDAKSFLTIDVAYGVEEFKSIVETALEMGRGKETTSSKNSSTSS